MENEITYAELIVYKPRAKNRIPFRHYTIDVAYLIFGDLCKPKNLIYFCANEVLKIIKMNCNMLTLQ